MTTITLSIAEIREKISKSPLHGIPAFFTINLIGGRALVSGDRFILDDITWLKLQLYVQAGRKLPTDSVSLKVNFGEKIEQALGPDTTQFLLTTYSSIYNHCGHFALETFPSVVSLANTVVNYAKDTATYYPEMDKLFDVLLDESEPNAVRGQAASNLLLISNALQKRTKEKSDEVANMSREVHAFKTETEHDKTQVDALNGRVEGLGVTSKEQINYLRQQVEYKKQEIKKANDEYLQHLKKARETAYYVWIPIFGWIAAPVVHGVENAAAKQALEDMKVAQKELEELEKDLENARLLAQSIDNSYAASQEIGGLINDALEGLAIMDAAWQRMSDDFGDISGKLVNWQNHLDVFAQMDFDGMKEKWKEIGDLASDYSSRAFMVVIV